MASLASQGPRGRRAARTGGPANSSSSEHSASPQLRPPVAIGCGAALQSWRRPMGRPRGCGCSAAGAARGLGAGSPGVPGAVGLSRGSVGASCASGDPGKALWMETANLREAAGQSCGAWRQSLCGFVLAHVWLRAGYQHWGVRLRPTSGPGAGNRSTERRGHLSKVTQRFVSLQRTALAGLLPHGIPESPWASGEPWPVLWQREGTVAFQWARPVFSASLVFSGCRNNLSLL